jgi:hypothetical protein
MDYPKWVTAPNGLRLVVKDAEEEAAVAEERALIEEIASAQDSTHRIFAIRPRAVAKGKRG